MLDRWGTGTECDNSCSGTITAQTYKNTTITLASSDTAFGNTLGVSGGTTYTDFQVSAMGRCGVLRVSMFRLWSEKMERSSYGGTTYFACRIGNASSGGES
jgi:hypothetical protein